MLFSRSCRLAAVSVLLFAGGLVFLVLPAAAQWGPPVDDDYYNESNEFVFLQDEVTEITVTMDPDDLQDILDDPFSDEYKMASVRIVNSKIDETYDEVGVRPRGNSSRNNIKLSWKIKFNEFVSGQNFHETRKLNLNGDASDPSLTRARLLWDVYRDMGVPAARTNYVHLVFNDGSIIDGMFVSIEQIEEEFVNAWFGNDAGDLYKCRGEADLRFIAPGTAETYRALEAYEEKINNENFVALADFINFLTFTPQPIFRTEIGSRVNVDALLRTLAVEVAAGSWDNYWVQATNYYLYRNAESGRFEYIPWDLDNSLGMDYFRLPLDGGTNWVTRPFEDWGTGGSATLDGLLPPLVGRILAIPEYERTLQRYIREVVERPMSVPVTGAKLDATFPLLESRLYAGTYSGENNDWGYEPEDFLESYDFPETYRPADIERLPATWGLRSFVRSRVGFVASNYPVPPPPLPVRVNEMVADNDSLIADEEGDFDDYVEIYNDGDVDFDIGGMYLTDYPSDPTQWRIPDGTVVPAKGFVLIWCDDEEGQGPLHTNFKLSGDGEGVWLFSDDASLHQLVDYLTYPELDEDVAFGRFPDGADNARILTSASPDGSNVTVEDAFQLTLEGACPGAATLYTSGSAPGVTTVLIAANGQGDFVIPGGPCAGTQLALNSTAVQLESGLTDALGTAIFPGAFPESRCSGFVQAIDLDTCEPTELIEP